MTDSKTNISFDEKYLAAIDLGTAKIGIRVAKVQERDIVLHARSRHLKKGRRFRNSSQHGLTLAVASPRFAPKRPFTRRPDSRLA